MLKNSKDSYINEIQGLVAPNKIPENFNQLDTRELIDIISLLKAIQKLQITATNRKDIAPILDNQLKAILLHHTLPPDEKLLAMKQATLDTYYAIRRSDYGSERLFGKGSRLGDALEKVIGENIRMHGAPLLIPHVVSQQTSTFKIYQPKIKDEFIQNAHTFLRQLKIKHQTTIDKILAELINIYYDENIPSEKKSIQAKQLLINYYYNFRQSEGFFSHPLANELEKFLQKNNQPVPHKVPKNAKAPDLTNTDKSEVNLDQH